MRKNSGILSALALLSVCALAGCAGAAPEATQAPSATAEVTPRPAAEPEAAPSWPVQLVPTSCTELLPQPMADAIFNETLPLGFQQESLYGREGIWWAAARNSGAVTCSWRSESVPDNPEETHSISVIVLPRAAEIAARISDELEGTVPGEPTVWCDWGSCVSGALLGEYWVSATIGGTGAPTEVVGANITAAFDQVMETVAALPPSSAPEFPAEAESWPTRCDEFVSEQTMADTLELPGAAFTVGYGYSGGNISYGTVLASGGLVCGIAREGGGRSGRIVTVPQSGELFAASRDQALLSDAVEAVEIAGLDSGSAFVTRDPRTPRNASLEMILRGTWVALSMGTDTVDEGDPAPQLIRLAEALAAG